MVNTTITQAHDYGLDVSTLPPHLAIITSVDFIHECDNEAIMLSFNIPEILQDVDPNFWPLITHQKLSEEPNSIGFVFWCLIQDKNGVESILGMSYLKNQGWSGFMSDIDFKSEPVLLEDPHDVMPLFKGYDFEQELLAH